MQYICGTKKLVKIKKYRKNLYLHYYLETIEWLRANLAYISLDRLISRLVSQYETEQNKNDKPPSIMRR